MPEISVIMAVYSLPDEKVLGASVASILGQTHRDFEFIICDDGSADGTWELLKKYAAADPRIRLLRSRRNRKAGHARNACIRRAQGKYVAVMDADDISAPGRLDAQRRYLEQHPEAAFAGCRGEFFVRQPGDDGEQYWFCRKPQARDFLFSLPFVHASAMFRREALERVHGYDGSRKAVRAEDYDLLMRLYAAGLRGGNLEEVLYYIRRDRSQYRRRKYRWRFHEAYVKLRGFRMLGLMPQAAPYVIKPFLAGLLPAPLMRAVQGRYYGKRQERPAWKGKGAGSGGAAGGP